MQTRAFTILVLSLMILLAAPGCTRQNSQRAADAAPALPVAARTETDAEQVSAVQLVGWVQDRSYDRKSLAYGLATKFHDSTLYIGVLVDYIGINTVVKSFRPGDPDARYELSDDPINDKQYWKLDVNSGKNELITKAQWHAASDRMSFTQGSMREGVYRHLGWWGTVTTVPRVRDKPGRPYMLPPNAPIVDVPSRIMSAMCKDMFSPTEVAAFVGTLRQPYSDKDDMCVEFMTRQGTQWHSLGIAQMVGTAGLRERDRDWQDLMGFVANGTRYAYLYKDRLWLVPVPPNPHLPAKPGAPAAGPPVAAPAPVLAPKP